MFVKQLPGTFIEVEVEADYLKTTCQSGGEYRALPCVVEHNGRTYGKTGWNSDKREAYYKQWAAANYAKARP